MSIPCKFERSLLTHEEWQVIVTSHHPAIYDVAIGDLKSLTRRLRDFRGKERTLAREKRRESRGKGKARGQGFPGTADHSFKRKQVFVAALKRVSKEIARREKLEARAANVEAAQRALAMRRAAQFPPRPAAGYVEHAGSRSLASQRHRVVISGAQIGRVSQATRNAQAARDARN